MFRFENAAVYWEGQGIARGDLSFGARIAPENDPQAERIPLPEGALVCPGFVDEHIHGAGGADAMDGTVDALATIADTVAKEGTTTFLATTMTQSEENIKNALLAVRDYRAAGRTAGARLGGVHLEGPFIAASHKGAQPLAFIKAPDAALFDAWNEASGNAVKIVTLAPEVSGMEDFIAHLVARGICVSLGHSAAKHDDIAAALAAGATHVTHTYNAQSALHHREIGVVGCALLYDELATELIADGIHVSAPAMRLLAKCKPANKLILVTDAMRAKGIADGESELGGQKVFVKNGEARLADGTLAGSILRMNVAVKNAVKKAGLPLTRAIDSATILPARAIGMGEEIGSIAPQKRADFAVLSPDFDVILTIRDGNIVYRA